MQLYTLTGNETEAWIEEVVKEKDVQTDFSGTIGRMDFPNAI